jgi:spore maturation protein CgeB
MGKKIMIVGSNAVYSLEQSYSRAAEVCGYEVMQFNPDQALEKYIHFGSFGKKLHGFFSVDSWVHKMNREFVIKVKNFQPDIILLFTTAKILCGSLITCKLVSGASIVWVWPDTPMNLASYNFDNKSIIDLSAVYSEKAIPYFKNIGFASPVWIPLAGDLSLHGCAVNTEEKYDRDLSFVGMWRPERERAMSFIVQSFPDISIEIYGKYWRRSCQNKLLLSKWKGEGLIGKELGNYFNRSRININVIDDTNYPAANMRFFEIPAAAGLQLTSSCPEMSPEFRDREHLVYFSNEKELADGVRWILDHPVECFEIRKKAKEKIDQQHNYIERFKSILYKLSNQEKE